MEELIFNFDESEVPKKKEVITYEPVEKGIRRKLKDGKKISYEATADFGRVEVLTERADCLQRNIRKKWSRKKKNYDIISVCKKNCCLSEAETMNKKRKEIIANNEISEIYTLNLGGYNQKVLEKITDTVKGVVVCGQIIKEVFFSEEVYEALQKSKLPDTKLSTIKNANIDKITPRELQLVSSSIRKYTSGYENKNGKATPMGAIIWGLLTSPDYKFKDFKAIMMNGYWKNVSLWKEILKLDLSSTLKNIKIPYTIIQGDTDIVASTKTVQAVAEESTYLKCKVVNNSGHYPNKEVMDMVYEELIAQIYGQ